MFVGKASSSATSATQEAMETAAQTKTEAAKGDQQAVRKLAAQQSANDPKSAQQPAVKTSTQGLDLMA